MTKTLLLLLLMASTGLLEAKKFRFHNGVRRTSKSRGSADGKKMYFDTVSGQFKRVVNNNNLNKEAGDLEIVNRVRANSLYRSKEQLGGEAALSKLLKKRKKLVRLPFR